MNANSQVSKRGTSPSLSFYILDLNRGDKNAM